MLIVDGHDSHIITKAIKYCINNNIVLIRLPSHSTDILQPSDVGIFSPLATAYKLQLEYYTWLGAGYSVDKADFIQFYGKARQESITVENVLSARRKSGLIPLNPIIVIDNILEPLKPRPITPPEVIVITLDNQCSFPYTPANSQQVHELIELLKNSHLDSGVVLSKMVKAASSAMAQNHCQQIIN